MNNFFKDLIEKYRVIRAIKNQKAVNVVGPKVIKHHKNLKKYISDLSAVGEKHHKLFFENLDKGDIEHRFGRLIAQRQNDLFQSVMLLIGFNYSISAIPLMRALCDTLLLLKYVELHPEYIKRFMNKDGGGIRITQIKKDITDQRLIDYYGFLSNLMHSNPESIKLNYYTSSNKKEVIIAMQPVINDRLNESHILSLIGILTESQIIVNNIYSTSWRPKIIKDSTE